MSLQGLYTASATPVLPTGCTTRQGLAFSSSRKHDSCSRHIYTRLLRGIFLLPSPLKGHAAEHTVFTVQHMWEITPQLTRDQLGAVRRTGELAVPWLQEGTSHTTTHTSTYSSAWQQCQTTTPTAGPDTSKATKPGPRHQAGLQMTCYLQKKEGLKKVCVKGNPWQTSLSSFAPSQHSSISPLA